MNKLFVIALSTLPCFAPAPRLRQSQDGQEKPHRASATISCVDSDGSLRVEVLIQILASDGYLASVFPGLRYGEEASVFDDPAGLYCSHSSAADELVSISVFCVKADRAKAALEALLTAIPKLRASGAEEAARRADLARKHGETVAARFARAREAMEKFIAANGAVEPAVFLERARQDFGSENEQHSQVRFEVAMQQTLRDALDKQLAALPAQVEERRVVPSLKRQLVQRQLEQIPEIRTENPQEASQILTLQMKYVDELEKRLSSGEFEDRVVVANVANDRRQEIVRQLYDAETRLAEIVSREAAHAKRVEWLRAEGIRLWRLSVEWDALNEEFDASRDASREAVSELANAERGVREAANRPGIRVVAGPQVR
jgi:hypothetical protein